MALATKIVSLTAAPVDLTEDTDVAAELSAAGGELRMLVQNSSTNKIAVLAESASAPTAGSRDGIVLGTRDAIIVDINDADPLWAWPTTTANVTLAQMT